MEKYNYCYAIESFYNGYWKVETYAGRAKDAHAISKIYKANIPEPVRVRKMTKEEFYEEIAN